LRKRSVALVLGALVLVLLVAGCGGGGDSSGGGSEPSPESTAFTAKANAICLKSNAKTSLAIVHAYKKAEAAGVDTEAEGKKLEATVIIPLVVTDAETQSKGISALPAPEGEEEKVKTLLGAYQAWIAKAKSDPAKIAAANDIFNEARTLAGKYPIVKCGLSPFEA
jgi:hypothetical protein